MQLKEKKQVSVVCINHSPKKQVSVVCINHSPADPRNAQP